MIASDKVVGTEYTILERRDATAMLWRFARSQARSVVHLWDAPEVVRRYLESGDETLRDAAWDAAWDAASAAGSAAARAAARDAASAAGSAAARAAARAADRAADRAASWDAAWAADRAASWDAARAEYDSMVNDLFGAPEA